MTPDELARSNSEHGHQRALFAWCNMAERHGFEAAWDDNSYRNTAVCPSLPVRELALIHAIPNGGLRDKRTAATLKAEGVKRGIPDVHLPLPCMNSEMSGYPDRMLYAGLYVEMKRPETTKAGTRKASIIDQAAGSTSNEQDAIIAELRRRGFAVSVCWEWREAAKHIQRYIELVRANA